MCVFFGGEGALGSVRLMVVMVVLVRDKNESTKQRNKKEANGSVAYLAKLANFLLCR